MAAKAFLRSYTKELGRGDENPEEAEVQWPHCGKDSPSGIVCLLLFSPSIPRISKLAPHFLLSTGLTPSNFHCLSEFLNSIADHFFLGFHPGIGKWGGPRKALATVFSSIVNE